MEPPSHPRLAVTYANDRMQDGAGAQLQRIYGVYALSRALGVPYVHTPLAHIGYHGLLALQENAPSDGLLEEYNHVFHIPSDIALPATVAVDEMQDADVPAIERLRDTVGDFHLVRICLPYPLTEADPEAYRCVRAISPFTYRRTSVFRLAIHVRRGEQLALRSHRMLPNGYYIACALRVQETLRRLGIPFVCELYTEAATETFEVTPQHHGISGRTSETMTYHPGMTRLEEFDALANVEPHVNLHPIETLGRMATADALIMSRSSFSFVAAILSNRCIVIYHPFWHNAMREWLIADEAGAIPEAELADRVESWKRDGAARQSASP
jgi:hypothetical protein